MQGTSYTPLIPARGKQRQADLCEFQPNQGYTVKPVFGRVGGRTNRSREFSG